MPSVVQNKDVLSAFLASVTPSAGPDAVTIEYITLLGANVGLDIRRARDGRRLASMTGGQRIGSVQLAFLAHPDTNARRWYAIDGSAAGTTVLGQPFAPPNGVTNTTLPRGWIELFDREAPVVTVRLFAPAVSPSPGSISVEERGSVAVPWGSPSLPVILPPASLPAPFGDLRPLAA
ncbi:MAG: hypothetical protein R3B70_03320 [Polyangiaceae bacterium]